MAITLGGTYIQKRDAPTGPILIVHSTGEIAVVVPEDIEPRINELLESVLPTLWNTDFFRTVDSVIREHFYIPINVEFMDFDRAPVESLPYLCQLVGIDFWTDVFGEDFQRALLKNTDLFTRKRLTKAALNKFFQLLGLSASYEFNINAVGAYESVDFQVGGLSTPLVGSQQDYIGRALHSLTDARIEINRIVISSGIVLQRSFDIPTAFVQRDHFIVGG